MLGLVSGYGLIPLVYHYRTTSLVSGVDEGASRMRMFVETADIHLYTDIVDFHKSTNVMIEQQMQTGPFQDALFVFCNRKRDKLKILFWDKTGLALYYVRLSMLTKGPVTFGCMPLVRIRQPFTAICKWIAIKATSKRKRLLSVVGPVNAVSLWK